MSHRRDPLPTDVRTLPVLPPEFDSILDAGLSTLELDVGPAERAAISS